MFQAKDFTKIYQEYRGKWVALDRTETKVLASSKKAQEALRQARTKGEKRPILMKIPEKFLSYIGFLYGD